jgi:hypothetical protein
MFFGMQNKSRHIPVEQIHVVLRTPTQLVCTTSQQQKMRLDSRVFFSADGVPLITRLSVYSFSAFRVLDF